MKYQFLKPWLSPLLVVSLLLLGAAKEIHAGQKSQEEDDTLAYMKGRQKVLDGKFQEALPLLERALKTAPESASMNHELAQVHLQLGNLDRAEELAAKAVEKEAANVQYRVTYGGILAGQKKIDESKVQYNKALELDPANARFPLMLAMLEAESGNPEAGVKILSQAIEANSENYLAFYYRAKLYREQEKLKEAQADLDKCVSLKPSFVEGGTALGMLFEQQGLIDEAIVAYNKIQGGGQFQKRLGQLYLSKNDFDKALAEFQSFEKLVPDDYSVRVKIGLILVELKRHKDAVDKFKSILKEQPDAGNVRFYLGVVFEELKQWDNAMVEFKRVPGDSSFFKESNLHVGFILKETSRFKEGVEFSGKLLKKYPETAEFYDMQASFYEQLKDYPKALKIIADAIAKFPKEEKLLYYQGALQDKAGDRKGAIVTMRKVIDSNPKNAHALNFLGYTYAEMSENLEEAEKLVQQAAALRPTDGYIQDSLGWVYYKMGKYDEALKHLEKAISLQVTEAVIYEHMGDIYAKKNDETKAIEMWKKAAAISAERRDKESAKRAESKIASIEKDKRLPSNAK